MLSFFLNTLSLVMMMTEEPKDNNLKGVKGGPKKAPRPRGNTPTMGSPLKKGKPPLTLTLIQIQMLNPKRVVKRGKKHFWPKKSQKRHKKVAVYFFHIRCCHVLKQSWAHYLCNWLIKYQLDGQLCLILMIFKTIGQIFWVFKTLTLFLNRMISEDCRQC